MLILTALIDSGKAPHNKQHQSVYVYFSAGFFSRFAESENCLRFSKERRMPSDVRGPVLMPPWYLHFPFLSAKHLHGVPFRVFAPHTPFHPSPHITVPHVVYARSVAFNVTLASYLIFVSASNYLLGAL